MNQQWFCVLCGVERDLADFGKQRCKCGSHAIQTKGEEHRFSEEEAAALAAQWKTPPGVSVGTTA